MTIAIADFLDLADSIAAQAQELEKEMGDGTVPGTASFGAQSNIDRIINLGVGNPDAIEDLLEGFREQFSKVSSVPVAYDRYSASIRALSTHVEGVDSFLTAQGERVASEFKSAIEMLALGILDPANTFSPVVLHMGEITITGLTAGTYVHPMPGFPDNGAIDITKYYASNMVLIKTTVAAGADAITLRCTCMKWDGTTETKDVPVDANDAINTECDIGVHGADMYTEITDIDVFAGGGIGIGEAWEVKSEIERTVSL